MMHVMAIKHNRVFGDSQNHTLLIKQFLKPFTKNVTGFKFKNLLSHGILTLSAFHNIADSQNIAVIKDFIKFTKSLLIAPINDENNAHKVKNIKDKSI